MKPAISIHDVAKSFRIYKERNQSLKATLMRRKRNLYDDFWALKEVSFDIPEGSTFGLMGHNGSGKSTLLKCIARILTPNTGHIETFGTLAAMLELGSGFHPELTGRENVYLNGSILGMNRREIDARFDEITDFAGVGPFIDQPVKSYSSGMYVRLGFSVAIHVEPDILLVDEILAVGDMQFQEKCKQKFADFKDSGRTVVVVSHGMGDVRSFCDLAAWLDHGHLVEVGPAAAIVDSYIEAGHSAEPTAGGGVRHGNGDIQISQIEVLGAHTKAQSRFEPRDAMTVRLHWHTRRPVQRPVFGLSIQSADGVHVWSHHTRDADYIPRMLDGEGTIEISLPHLNLQPGSYNLNSSVVDFELANSYDQWVRGAKFEVTAIQQRESGGVVMMGSHWQNLQPATEMVPAAAIGD